MQTLDVAADSIYNILGGRLGGVAPPPDSEEYVEFDGAVWAAAQEIAKFKIGDDGDKLKHLKALQAIERLLCDSFAEDVCIALAMHPETMSDNEREMARRIGIIYRIAHSSDTTLPCYKVHKDWRKMAGRILGGKPPQTSADTPLNGSS